MGVMMRTVALITLLLLPSAALAQTVPQGALSLNQASQFRALTKSDTATFPPTRGLHIGDASACNVAVIGAQDTAAVTFNNVQSGQILPFSVTKLMSTNTTCATVTGLW
jgi:hypothetical protein